ncbi:MAG TPA: response regulator [Longimicrobium sp.]|nr:response regulator [Longimicrobium sp.]
MSPPSIVLIEDDEASQYVYGTLLRREGYNVRLARFGGAGLRAVREDPPDIVVLDLGLPEVDGIDVLRQLKSDPATRHVPVLVLTVHVFEHDREAAMAAGCDEFLCKPLSPSELLAIVRRTLDRCGPATPPAAPGTSS